MSVSIAARRPTVARPADTHAVSTLAASVLGRQPADRRGRPGAATAASLLLLLLRTSTTTKESS